ncbi:MULTISPECIES: hypothetical protein [unclassified Moorena]|nr:MULTISPECIES: hypothetical protein [unclassified Moorena]
MRLKTAISAISYQLMRTLLEVLLNTTGKHWNNAELRQHLK